MKSTDTPLPGVRVLEPAVFREERGWFMETWSSERYAALGLPPLFVQDNVSYSVPRVLRGMHFQHPTDQGKLVSVLDGEIFDVVVDIRPDSKTFKKWFGVTLSSANRKQLWVPVGYAHGFLARTASLVTYKVTAPYDPAAAQIVHWADEDLAIDWQVADPILSPKDAAAPRLREIRSELLPRADTET